MRKVPTARICELFKALNYYRSIYFRLMTQYRRPSEHKIHGIGVHEAMDKMTQIEKILGKCDVVIEVPTQIKGLVSVAEKKDYNAYAPDDD